MLLRIEFTASDTLEPTGALLPHLSTFSHIATGSLFLLHFSSDRSGRALPVILALWSPDFPHNEHDCKPGSVFDSHLSTRRVAAVLQPPRERSGQPIAPIPVLLRIEFTASDTLEPTGALLPHLSILT